MSVDILDFFPTYPSIDSPSFYQTIYNKREFRELTLAKNEIYDFSDYLPNQKIISRFLSPYTLYDNLLLYHEMGTGKTCAAVGVSETLKSAGYKGCLYFAKGQGLINNFVNELIYKCTKGEYLPGEYNSEGEKNFRENAQIKNFYSMHTYQTFAKNFTSNTNIYDNHIIILDEVHNIVTNRFGDGDSDYNFYFEFLHNVKNCKILLLSGTPIRDKIDTFTPIMNLILPLDKQIDKSLDLDNLTTETLNNLKTQIKGYVSFLATPKSDVKRTFITNTEIDNMFYNDANINFPSAKKFMLYFEMMSPWQTFVYLNNGGNRLGKDLNIITEENTPSSAAYSDIRQLSLFVHPPIKKIKINFEFTSQYFKNDVIKNTGISSIAKGREKNYSTIVAAFNNYFEAGFKQTWNLNKDDISQFTRDWNNYLTSEFGANGFVPPPDDQYLREQISLKKLSGEDSVKEYLKMEWKLSKLKQCSIVYYNSVRTIMEGIENGKKIFIYNTFINNVGIYLFYHILTKIFGFHNCITNPKQGRKNILILTADTMTNNASQIKSKINEFNTPENKNGDLISIIIGSKIISEGFTFKNVQIIDVQTPGWNYAEISQAIARGYRIGSHNDLIESGVIPEVNIYQRVNLPNYLNQEKFIKSIDLLMYEFAANKDISIKNIERVVKIAAFDCSLTKNRNYKQLENGCRECDYTDCEYTCEGNIIMDDKIEDISYNMYYAEKYKQTINKQIKLLFKFNNSLTLDQIITNLNIDNKNIFLILDVLNSIITNNEILYTKYGLIKFLRERNNVYFCVNNIFSNNNKFLNYYSANVSFYEYNTINNLVYDTENLSQISILNKIYETGTKDIANNRVLFQQLSPNLREDIIKFAKQVLIKDPQNDFALLIVNLNTKTEAKKLKSNDQEQIKNKANSVGLNFYGILNKGKFALVNTSTKEKSGKLSSKACPSISRIGRIDLSINKWEYNNLKKGYDTDKLSFEQCFEELLNGDLQISAIKTINANMTPNFCIAFNETEGHTVYYLAYKYYKVDAQNKFIKIRNDEIRIKQAVEGDEETVVFGLSSDPGYVLLPIFTPDPVPKGIPKPLTVPLFCNMLYNILKNNGLYLE